MEPAQNVNVLGMKALINNSGKLGISSDNEFISCEILINFYSLEWLPIVSNSRLAKLSTNKLRAVRSLEKFGF